MSDQITYDDKVDLQVATNIANINKVTASDMNEIKNVVNGNADEVGDISTLTTTDKTSVVNAVNELDAPEKWVSVGTTAPTDGRRVWFEKGKNLFDGQLELGMYDETGAKATNNTNYRNVAPINVQPSTTYTFSINGTSQKYVIYLYKKDGTFIRVNTLTSGTFTTPAEAYLLNFRCFNADFTSDYANLKIQLEQGSNATSYEPYIEQSIKVDNEDFVSMSNLVSVGANQPGDDKRVWFKKGKNLYNNALISANLLKTRTTVTYENGQIVMSTTGADAYFGNIVSVGNSWSEQYGQLISVEPNTNYTLSITNNVVDKNFITYYDENKVSIKIDYNQPYQVTFTTPNNAKYVSFRFGTANSTSDGVYKFNIQLEKGSTATTYEPYVEPSINVDGEEWYTPSFAIKTKVYPSVTTSDTGYYNLNLLSNEVAVIGIKHNPVESATKIELYSNQLGQVFIRVSVGGVYSARTIYNLIVYYI